MTTTTTKKSHVIIKINDDIWLLLIYKHSHQQLRTNLSFNITSLLTSPSRVASRLPCHFLFAPHSTFIIHSLSANPMKSPEQDTRSCQPYTKSTYKFVRLFKHIHTVAGLLISIFTTKSKTLSSKAKCSSLFSSLSLYLTNWLHNI